MLQGISGCDYNPRGKKISQIGIDSKKHNFNIGIKEWERPLGSVYHYQNFKRIPDPVKYKPPHPSSSQVEIPHEHSFTNQRIKDHFSTEAGKSFVKYVNPARTRPVLSTQDLTQSKYVKESLNNGFPYGKDTQSQSQDFLTLKDPKLVKDVKWKSQREVFNPITNEIYTQEKMRKSALFEFYNEQRQQKRVSNNHSQIPKLNERIDIITGRRLPPFLQ